MNSLFDRFLGLFNRKRSRIPEEGEFGGLPVRTPDRKNVWKTSKPICRSLPDGDSIWVHGWLAPQYSVGDTGGVAFFYNGQRSSSASVSFLSDFFRFFAGSIALVHYKNSAPQSLFDLPVICSEVRKLVETEYYHWLRQADHHTRESVLGSQPLPIVGNDYGKTLVQACYPLPTSKGPQTFNEIKDKRQEAIGGETPHRTILATSALSINNPALLQKYKDGEILDLRGLHLRRLVENIAKSDGYSLKFIDHLGSPDWEYAEHGRDPDERRLLKFFRDRFDRKPKSHGNVRVALDTTGVLKDFPAGLFPMEAIPTICPPGLPDEELCMQWLEN